MAPAPSESDGRAAERAGATVRSSEVRSTRQRGETLLPVVDTVAFRGSLVLTAAAVLGLAWASVCTVPGVQWNAPRMAASFAIRYGQPLYALRDSGAHLGWFYGPVFPLWYLPATVTSNPTIALMIAAVVNILTLLVPFAVVLRVSGVARGRALLAGMVVVAALILGDTTMHRGFFFVHVDVVCLALGILACVALWRATTGGGRPAIHIAAAALVLACWTKQIACVVAAGMFAWLWFDGHRRLLWAFFFWSVVYTALSTIAVFAAFGAAEVLFNTVLVHQRNPLDGGWALLGQRLVEWVQGAWTWAPLVLALLWFMRRPGRTPLPTDARSLIRLFLWVATVQLPIGLFATLKAGGGLNSVHSVSYLLVVLMMVAGWELAQPLPSGRARRLGAIAGLLLLVPAIRAYDLAIEGRAVWTLYRGQERLLEVVRKEPSRMYLPWNPLITLIVDRRIYPADDALYCLWKAGLEVPAEKVRAAVPAKPIILYEEPVQSKFALRYFPRNRDPVPPAAVP